MPWNNQGGGGWQGPGGDGGPWGGRRPSGGGGGGGGGGQPPDLEDLIRKMQDKGKRFMPGGFGGIRGIVIILIVLVAVWLASGIYRVDTNQQGVELVFGKLSDVKGPGLEYNWPYPIGTTYTPTVTEIQQFTVGGTASQSLMLTGDENIIDVKFVVKWKISNAGEYLFNVERPEETTRMVAESAMRQVIGQTALSTALAEGRAAVEQETLALVQEMLDHLKAGILITQVELQNVDPPSAVIDAFRDVQRARADLETQINEAETYSNDILPRARGEAVRLIQEAEAYREQVVKTAEGDAQRFLSIYGEYKDAREITARRMYLETMEKVLGRMTKIIIDSNDGQGGGVVPYLPLNELTRSPSNTGGTQ